MTVPTLHVLSEQTFAVADSYWMCGNDVLLNTTWIGLSKDESTYPSNIRRCERHN